MMDELKKMMAKKAGKSEEMDQTAIEAKLDVIKELMEMAHAAMAGKVKGGLDEMHKVTVAAPDAEGLEEGLEMAEDVIGDKEDDKEETEETPEVEGMSSLMEKHEDPEEEENPFARKRAKELGRY